MKSKFFRILAQISLLLCVVTFLVGLRGLWRVDRIDISHGREAMHCIASDGLMRFQYFNVREGETYTPFEWTVTPNNVQWHPYWGWPNRSFINNIGLGIEIQNRHFMECLIPFWLPCLLTAILPALWLRPWWWDRGIFAASCRIKALPWRQYRYRLWLRRLLVLVSLALLAAALTFWARSYRASDTLILTWSYQYRLTWQSGTAYLERRHFIILPQSFRPQSWRAPYSNHPYFGFETNSTAFPGYVFTPPQTLVLPTWGTFTAFPGMINGTATSASDVLAFPAWVLATFPALWQLWAFFTRTNRHPKSHCQSCGYNLTGNPSATACPECGKATPSSPKPPAP